MSTNLYWIDNDFDPQYLGKALKYSIAPKYWGHDGTLGGQSVYFTKKDIPYLEGVRDGSVGEVSQEAQLLIDLIEKYKSVEVQLRG